MTADAPRNSLVTVVLPTYNWAHLIRETLDSILAQTFRDFELIVIADGCTDNTAGVVASYGDPRIRLISQPGSGRPAKPRNVGIQNARGTYVAFCDHDDLWMPDKLPRQTAVMSSEPDVAMCFTGGVTFGDDRFLSKRTIKKGVHQDHFRTVLYGNYVPSSSVLARRAVLEAVGPFRTEKSLRGVEDYEMWLRISRHGRLVCLDEPLIRYRVCATNLGGNHAKATLQTLRVLRSLYRDQSIREPLLLPGIVTDLHKLFPPDPVLAIITTAVPSITSPWLIRLGTASLPRGTCSTLRKKAIDPMPSRSSTAVR
jgi:teichuronic acid biosynthesis glycosyltransferase TuaG